MRKHESPGQGRDQSPSAEVSNRLELKPEEVRRSRGDGENDKSEPDQAKHEGVPSGKRRNRSVSGCATSVSSRSLDGFLGQEGDHVTQEEGWNDGVDKPKSKRGSAKAFARTDQRGTIHTTSRTRHPHCYWRAETLQRIREGSSLA